MENLNENTKDLVTNCIIRRLSTKEALEYLSKNKISVSERTYRRYKNEVLKQQHTLKDYAWNNVQIEQMKKIETKKNILRQCWNLFDQAEKIPEKMSLLKTIEKISDELPEIVWKANKYAGLMAHRKIEGRIELGSLQNLSLEDDEDESQKSGQFLGTKWPESGQL
jgi:hypothetical protein